MSLNTENTANASETLGAEKINENINRISPNVIKKKIRANLELLCEQILSLIWLLNKLTLNNSKKTTPTEGSCCHGQTGLSFSMEAGVSETSPDTAIAGTGPSPDRKTTFRVRFG